MAKGFEDRILEERKKLRVSKDDLKARVDASPYGSKTKEYLKRWIDVESTGEV